MQDKPLLHVAQYFRGKKSPFVDGITEKEVKSFILVQVGMGGYAFSHVSGVGREALASWWMIMNSFLRYDGACRVLKSGSPRTRNSTPNEAIFA